MIPLPSGRGEQPTNTPVFGSRVNLKSVGPSCRLNKACPSSRLLPIAADGLNDSVVFSSAPVPSSNNVTENVFDAPAIPVNIWSPICVPTHPSDPNSGTLIHLTLNAFTLANPNACTGNEHRLTARALGFKSVHAGAILGSPCRNCNTSAVLSVSPAPNVMFPFEFRKNPFHTQVRESPLVTTGGQFWEMLALNGPNTNSNPPLSGPRTAGVPPANTTPSSHLASGTTTVSESSPRNGVF